MGGCQSEAVEVPRQPVFTCRLPQAKLKCAAEAPMTEKTNTKNDDAKFPPSR